VWRSLGGDKFVRANEGLGLLNAFVRTDDSHSEPEAHKGFFATTHWSVVMAAGQRDSPQAAEALEKLCHTYWYPLYAYVRRRGHNPTDAQDLTQEFFARFLARNYLAGVQQERARFRSYLLGAMNHFLSDAWDHAHRQKRAAAQENLPIDGPSGEARYAIEPADELSPDRLFDRRWALTLLDQVLGRLRVEYQTAGKALLFEKLNGFLTGETKRDRYHQTATELGVTEGNLRVAIHRLRKRYGELFLSEVAQTVSAPEEVREEMLYLLSAASG
jgi:RNA polymerase sigma factor (sigma-70 family)